LSWSTSSLYLR